ncbi:MAG: helix-turn-helix domain-containing protein [Oscillospiraceae bacterium]|nr:helix-turn-helix domain-containing protein [Oscillospiraceae bacterium]
MGFGELLSRAQVGEQAAFDEILSMYQPLLVKMSVVDRRLDEDMYQELSLVLLKCVRKFQIKG